MTVKAEAIHTVHIPNGTEQRPRLHEGRIVLDASGKEQMRTVTKIIAVPPGGIFPVDDDEFEKLRVAGAAKKARADAAYTHVPTDFDSGTEKSAPAPVTTKTRGAGKGAKAAKAAPASTDDDSTEDLV